LASRRSTSPERFLDPEILPLLKDSLAVVPTSVLTNGTRIDVRMAAALARLAGEAAYSLDIRVSRDDVDEQRNDSIRGRGAWRNAVRAIQLLAARGILPIVTATEILSGHEDSPGAGMYQEFRDFLLSLGIEKARVKILPVFPAGRLASTRNVRLIEADLWAGRSFQPVQQLQSAVFLARQAESRISRTRGPLNRGSQGGHPRRRTSR
jgi:MoaA/NifB/PqqE/SkfB family radical SAM enzyme